MDGDLRRLFAAHDAKVIREGYGQLPAWFARLPAQPRGRQVRRVFVSAGVAACLAPLFGPPKGRAKSKHLGRESLAVLETPWRTAYHYDLFAGDVGHTLMLGATGSGKSFTLNFLLVEALRYDPRVLILDLGGSYRWLTRFLGGRYLELSPGEAEPTLRLQPFALPAGTRTFQFLTGWVLRLLKLGGWEASGADTSEIRARIEDLYAFEPERRTLSVLASSLPSATWPAWSRWIEGGAWGAYFDNPAVGAPDLEFADWQVIDLAGAVEHPDLCDAALSYLLERMRLEVEDPAEATRLKLMVVDEAWRYLQDPAVLSYLAEAAKTWRKKNAALIMATQSAVDVTSTPGAAALLESIPTKLFLANPELPDAVGALFRLSESELAQVRGLIPKRELYLRRPDGAAVLRVPSCTPCRSRSVRSCHELGRLTSSTASRCKAQPGIAGLGYGETVHPTLHLVKLFSERRHARDFLRGRLHVNRLILLPTSVSSDSYSTRAQQEPMPSSLTSVTYETPASTNRTCGLPNSSLQVQVRPRPPHLCNFSGGTLGPWSKRYSRKR